MVPSDTPLPADAPNLTIAPHWERPVAAVGEETTLLIRIAATAPADGAVRRAPVDVAFVLDHSGSMAGAKLELVKRAVDVAAGHLRDADRAALVVYDHTVSTLHSLQPATPRAKTALRLALHGVDAGGSTDLGGGWLTGCRELSDATPTPSLPATGNGAGATRVRRALLLTDGLANVGITDPTELTTHAHELRKRGVATTTLGVGLDFDEALLSGLAEAGGGNFQFIAGPEQLPAFFARELQELLTIVAAGLTLTLTLPPNIEASLVNAFPTERAGDRLTIAFGDLPAGDELDAVLRLRVTAGEVGETVRLSLSAAWSDPVADARRSLDVTPLPIALAEPAVVATQPPDPLVAERAALQIATAERREALLLDRAGRHAESRARMAHAVAFLQAAPQSAEIAEDLAISMHLASAPPVALSAHDRKQSTWWNSRRNRGKREGGDRSLR
jgi:Ca-activated chloride channel family protein